MKAYFFDVLNILGTFAFAVSGTSEAMRKKLDIFGILIIAFVTSIGGGTLRDMLIGKTPVAWMQNETIIGVIAFATLITIVFGTLVTKLNYTLFIFDAIGLGVATIAGIQKGVDLQLSVVVCIALGTMSGCFGGVIRDTLLNEIPLIFRKEIYALACIVGGICYYTLIHFGYNDELSQITCIVLIVVIRILAIKYRWSLPSIY